MSVLQNPGQQDATVTLEPAVVNSRAKIPANAICPTFDAWYMVPPQPLRRWLPAATLSQNSFNKSTIFLSVNDTSAKRFWSGLASCFRELSIDATFTIRPACDPESNGRSARVARMVPKVFVFTMARASSAPKVPSGYPIPALFTRRSSLPPKRLEMPVFVFVCAHVWVGAKVPSRQGIRCRVVYACVHAHLRAAPREVDNLYQLHFERPSRHQQNPFG